MIRAKVTIAGNPAVEVDVDAAVLGCDDPVRLAKYTVEAWWRSRNWAGEYHVTRDMIRNIKFEGSVFSCMVDRGTTLIVLDLSNTGGPW